MPYPIILILALLLPLQAQATTLKIATLAPDGTSWMKAMRAGAKEIEERSSGRVKLRFYPGGVMGNDKSVLRKIRVGQLHGGALTGGGLVSIFPDSQVYSLPFMFHSLQEADYVRKAVDPLLYAGLEQAGFISFGISEGGFAYLMSNQPLSRVEELRQQKVWSPEGDEVGRIAFEALGVSPIPLPLPDVLTGLQTGLINTVATSPVGAIALQWHTRVKYLTDIPLLYLYGTLVIQKRAFNRLSPEDQAIVRSAMEKAFQQVNEQSRKDNEGAMEALKSQGIQFIHPSPDDLTQWRALIHKTVNQMAEQGVYSPQMLETVRRHLGEYRGQNQVGE
ncbi:TRAP transporter substrate-binding protein DctP [Pseudomonadota bacterium]